MAGVVTIGLKGVSLAPIGVDGTPGTNFTKFGNVSTDSFAFAEAEPNVKSVNVEEFDAALKEFKTKGQLTITLNIADANADMFALVRGGVATTAGGLKTYKDGDSFVNVERTVKIEPAEGLSFIINRASISGLLNGGLGKNQELYLSITITALQPLKAGVSPMEVIEVVPA